MRQILLLLACCGLALVLSGCGNKGPLYLPSSPEQIPADQGDTAEEDDNG